MSNLQCLSTQKVKGHPPPPHKFIRRNNEIEQFSSDLFCPLVGLAPLGTVGVYLLAFLVALGLQKG
jgi:hypothetical protein